MTDIAEFTFKLGFSKPDYTALEAATKVAKAKAKEAADAYAKAAKDVEAAQEAVRAATDKASKKVAQEALRAARAVAKGAKDALREAETVARDVEKAAASSAKEVEKAVKKAAQEAEKAAEKQAAAIKAIGAGVFGAVTTGVGVAIAAIAGASTAAGAFVYRWTASVNEIAKTSKKLDVPVEQLQRLRFAGEKTGVSPDALQQGLKDSAKLIGEGRANAKSPIALIAKEIGLNLDELAAMQPEKRIGAIADALLGIEDPSLRAAAQLKFFGEEAGVQLTPLLARGSAGIAELGNEAERLGVVLDEETTKKAEAFQDQLKNVQARAGGVAAAVGVELLPVFADVIDRTEDWVENNEEFIKQDLPNAVRAVADAVGGLVSMIAEGVSMADEFGTEIRHIYEDNKELFDFLARAGKFAAGGFVGQMIGDGTFGGESEGDGTTSIRGGATFLNPENATRQAQERAARAAASAEAAMAAAQQAGMQAKLAEDVLGVASVQGAADNLTAQLVRANRMKQQGRGLRSALGGGGGGSASASEKEKKEIAALVEQLRGGALGTELSTLATRFGAGTSAVDSALEDAARAQLEGANAGVMRQRALGKLGGLTGQDLAPKKSKDPLLSAIFGEDVPDVELGTLAMGAEPQVLIATINNTFNFENHQDIDGTGDPGAVASRSVEAIQDWADSMVSKSTKTAKLNYVR